MPETDKTATIRITRKNDYFGLARKLKVYVDNKHVGNVRWKNSVDISVPPGRHEFYVKMDWCRSTPIQLNIRENDLVEYEVLTPGSGSVVGLFRQLYDLVFNYSDFFELRKH